MAGKWRELSLREAGVQLLDCDHRTPTAMTTGVPYVAIPQLKNGRIDLTDVRRISPGDYLAWTKKTEPRAWDVIVSRRCNPGETAVVPPELKCALGQNLVILRSAGGVVFPPFLRWLLRSPAWWNQIRTFINVGAIFESLKCADIPNFRLPIPPIPEQQAIACILGSLDDKIELNRRLNRTLEAMAQAIFKSWFIDFDPVRAKAAGQQPPGLSPEIAAFFPDSFQDSELGEIPRGWSVGTLGTIAHEVRDSVNPSQIEENCPYIALEHIPKRCITLDSWSVANSVASGKLRFRRGDILFGKLRPYFHKVGPAPIDGVCSTDIVVARPKRPCWYGIMAGYLTDDAFVAFTDRGSAGTKMPRTNWRDMASFAIAVPGSELAERHSRIVISLYEKINSAILQSRILAELRDALLQKLISGQLVVAKAENLLGRCV